MKNYTKILFAIAFAIFTCATVAMADRASSFEDRNKKAQRTFGLKVLEYYNSKDFDGLKTYIDSIPACRRVNRKAPEVCNIDLTDGKNFLDHDKCYGLFVDSHSMRYGCGKGAADRRYEKDFTIISASVSMINQLSLFSINTYNTSLMRETDTAAIKNLYEYFKDSWLSDKVLQTIVYYQTNSAKPGLSREEIYELLGITDVTLQNEVNEAVTVNPTEEEPEVDDEEEEVCTISSIINPDDKYKIRFNLERDDAGRSCVQEILASIADGTLANSPYPSTISLEDIANYWFKSLITPVQQARDGGKEMAYYEKEYVESNNNALKYKAAKQIAMYKFFNHDGWKMFIDAGVVPDSWDKHTTALNIKSCTRVFTNHKEPKGEEICSAFESGAKEYGFTEELQPIVEQTVQNRINGHLASLQ